MSARDDQLLAHLAEHRARIPVGKLDQGDTRCRDFFTRHGVDNDEQVHAVIFGLSIAFGITVAHRHCPCLLDEIRNWQAACAGQLKEGPRC